jgi:hypothetical protein
MNRWAAVLGASGDSNWRFAETPTISENLSNLSLLHAHVRRLQVGG